MKVKYFTLIEGKVVGVNREVEFQKTFDVVVCGGGTAGVVSAITLKNLNATFCIIDENSALGGTSTVGGVWPYYFGRICDEVRERIELSKKLLKSGIFVKMKDEVFDKRKEIRFPVAVLSIANDRVLQGENVYYKSKITGVFVKGGKVVGIEFLQNSELKTVGCVSAIDCCNGFVARLAGCKTDNGRKSDGRGMLFSRYIAVATKDGIQGKCAHCGYFWGLSGETERNVLSSATSSPCLLDKYGEEDRVVFHSGILGRRDVRRVQTKQTSTVNDWLKDGTNEYVYYSFSHLDNANTDFYNEDEPLRLWNFLINAHAIGIDFGVKMGSLITEKYSNLFLAGKHIGVDYSSTGFIRMKADIEKCGEVSAIIANTYVKYGKVNYGLVKPQLEERRLLDVPEHKTLYNLNFENDGNYVATEIPNKTEDILKYVSGDCKEYGYIGALAYGNKRELISKLTDIIDTDVSVCEDIAITLGILHDKNCLPFLREIVNKGKASFTVRKDDNEKAYPWLKITVHCNFTKALCLLCGFGDNQCVDSVRNIYEDNAEKVVSEMPFPFRETQRSLIVGFAKKYLEQCSKENIK